jgi:hypothetical protein
MGKGGITRSLLFRLGCALFSSSLARKYIFLFANGAFLLFQSIPLKKNKNFFPLKNGFF